jgi:hypothetical protein
MDKLNRLGWAVYKSYEVGGHQFGIRTNSETCAEWLDSTLGAYETDDETEPWFSLWAPVGAVGKGYYVLHRGTDDVIRTLDPAHVAQRLLAEIEGFLLRERTDLLFFEAAVVQRDGVAALVPAEIVPYLRIAGRHVESELSLPIDGALALDAQGRLQAMPHELATRAACLDLADRFGVRVAELLAVDPPVPPSVDLVLAFHYQPELPPRIPMSRGLAVAAFGETALNLPAMPEQGLRSLAALVAGTPGQLVQSGEAARLTVEYVCDALAEVGPANTASAA